jgi:hypothetical protein
MYNEISNYVKEKNMKLVIFRCDDKTKSLIEGYSRKIGSTMSETIRRAITKYMRGKKP